MRFRAIRERLTRETPLFDLIWTETEGRRGMLLTTLLVSGVANGGILAIVNKATESSKEGADLRLLLLFLIALGAYVVCQKYVFSANVRIFQGSIKRIRMRLANKIRHGEFLEVEGLGRSEIYDAMTRETLLIGNSGLLLAASLQAATLGIFIAGYIAYMSLPALVLIVVLGVVGSTIFRMKQKAAGEYLQTVTEGEIAFVDIVGHTLDGFKEAKLNARRSRDIYGELGARSEKVKDVNIKLIDLFSGSYIFFQALLYLLLAAVAFVLPRIFTTYGAVVNEISTAVLFISGPMLMLFSSIPTLAQANFAAAKIKRLEETLDELSLWTETDPVETAPPIPTSFDEIELVDLEYSFKNPDGEKVFTVGPASLKIRAGETLFLVGGNGSGKSSLLYLLTGLFQPDSGSIFLDGKPVTEGDLQDYRELFSAIFSDFHLFDRLYGLLDVEPEKVRELLAQMDLEEKTDFVDGRFGNLELSTGQRKRLALVTCLLDDRPIFIFDELAADQDPQFREYLYTELFEELKGAGKTIIAVSHDDRYFQVADRVLQMDYGSIARLD